MVRRCYLLMIALFASTALWAVAQPSAEELEQRRRQVEALRQQPEQLARLRENLQAFLSSPRRDAVVKLDRDMQDLSAKKKQRLYNVLDRYADWLEELRKRDPQAFNAIKDAPDTATRLTLIRDRRDREWIEQQPKTYRDQWEKLPPDERSDYVANLRRDDRRNRMQWLMAQRFWRELESKQPMPSRLSDFVDGKSDKVKKYVEDYLMPFLSVEEKNQLENVEGRWPEYAQALVAIASRHPSALPPPSKEALPTRMAQLPVRVRERVEEKKGAAIKGKTLQKLEPFIGRPNFASKVVEFGTKDGKVPFEHEFWASNYKSLLPPMKEFVDKKLIPVLTDSADLKKLNDNEGRWPYYPETIQELAKKHKLSPPWHILPEPERWKWDLYRKPHVQSWGYEAVKEKKSP